MSYYICDEGKIAIDRIFKIEEIRKIDKYLKRIGIKDKLSEVSMNQSDHKPWKDYMNKDMIEEINEIYRTDFELFDYKML